MPLLDIVIPQLPSPLSEQHPYKSANAVTNHLLWSVDSRTLGFPNWTLQSSYEKAGVLLFFSNTSTISENPKDIYFAAARFLSTHM